MAQEPWGFEISHFEDPKSPWQTVIDRKSFKRLNCYVLIVSGKWAGVVSLHKGIRDHRAEELDFHAHVVMIVQVTELGVAVLTGRRKDLCARFRDLINFDSG